MLQVSKMVVNNNFSGRHSICSGHLSFGCRTAVTKSTQLLQNAAGRVTKQGTWPGGSPHSSTQVPPTQAPLKALQIPQGSHSIRTHPHARTHAHTQCLPIPRDLTRLAHKRNATIICTVWARNWNCARYTSHANCWWCNRCVCVCTGDHFSVQRPKKVKKTTEHFTVLLVVANLTVSTPRHVSLGPCTIVILNMYMKQFQIDCKKLAEYACTQ